MPMQALPARPFSHPSYHCHSSGAQLAGASARIKKPFSNRLSCNKRNICCVLFFSLDWSLIHASSRQTHRATQLPPVAVHLNPG